MSAKPRLIEVTDPREVNELNVNGDNLNLPMPHYMCGKVYVDADELRQWRAAQSQSEGGK